MSYIIVKDSSLKTSADILKAYENGLYDVPKYPRQANEGDTLVIVPSKARMKKDTSATVIVTTFGSVRKISEDSTKWNVKLKYKYTLEFKGDVDTKMFKDLPVEVQKAALTMRQQPYMYI